MENKKDTKTESFPETTCSDIDTVNVFGKIRNFLIRLLVGKKSILLNCKLISSKVTINNNTLLSNNKFMLEEDFENRPSGITIRPCYRK